MTDVVLLDLVDLVPFRMLIHDPVRGRLAYKLCGLRCRASVLPTREEEVNNVGRPSSTGLVYLAPPVLGNDELASLLLPRLWHSQEQVTWSDVLMYDIDPWLVRVQ